MNAELELIACQPHPIESKGFNPNATLLYTALPAVMKYSLSPSTLAPFRPFQH